MTPIKERMQELEPYYLNLRRKIHSHPEISLQETETTKLITKELQSYGIETYPNGNFTGVVGVLKGNAGSGKTIALRADIDALPLQEETGLPFASQNPGKCHACGHDIHTTTLLACAKLLSERKDELKGTVKFIFQPAEEGQAGAKTIIENGFLKDVDAIFAAHTWPEIPGGTIGIRRGPMMAGAQRFNITLKVKGGHAAHPHKTPDSVVIAAYIILGLQSIVSRELKPVDSAVITVGKMTAGTAANIIPSQVVLEGTFRYLTNEVRDHIIEAIQRIAVGTAQAHRAEASVTFIENGAPVTNEDSLVDLVETSAKELLGESKCINLTQPSMGSEDFAYYLEQKPGALFRLGTVEEGEAYRLALHNNKLLFSEKAIAAGAVTECGIVYLYTGSDIEKLK
jgi:amidohydrolase